MKKYIKTYKIDLIHALFATPHAFWAFFLSKPFIITTRGSDILVVIPELLKINGLRTIYNKLLFFLLKLSFRHAKHITGTSLKQIDKAIELFNVKNTSLIRTGIAVEKMLCSNQEKHLPKTLKNKKYIFCPRFLQPIYRNEMVVDAFSNLPLELKNDLTLVFILGQKKLPDYQTSIVESLKKDNINFVILNYLSQEALWATFHFAKLTVMTPASDGTPNSALEAMALKSPLIMGNLPYDSDLFEGTCLKMESDSIAELTSLVQIAIEDYPQNLIKEAFKRVNKYGNRDIEMMKLKKIYFD